MKKYKFELIIDEEDVAGDEFWEYAVKKDGTGIADLKEAIAIALIESNLFISTNKSVVDMIRLVEFSNH